MSRPSPRKKFGQPAPEDWTAVLDKDDNVTIKEDKESVGSEAFQRVVDIATGKKPNKKRKRDALDNV